MPTSKEFLKGLSEDWVERKLSTGFNLCVQNKMLLRISNQDICMFSVDICAIRQITIGPRISSAGTGVEKLSIVSFPYLVDVAHGSAHFSFYCSKEDMCAVRFIFADIPCKDLGKELGMGPST